MARLCPRRPLLLTRWDTRETIGQAYFLAFLGEGVTLGESMVEVWRQALSEGRAEVEVAGRRYPVTRTRARGLAVVAFSRDDRTFEGIEQNPETRSRWVVLARAGSKIMQFSWEGRYIANVCDGTLTRYPSWKAAGLGD